MKFSLLLLVFLASCGDSISIKTKHSSRPEIEDVFPSLWWDAKEQVRDPLYAHGITDKSPHARHCQSPNYPKFEYSHGKRFPIFKGEGRNVIRCESLDLGFIQNHSFSMSIAFIPTDGPVLFEVNSGTEIVFQVVWLHHDKVGIRIGSSGDEHVTHAIVTIPPPEEKIAVLRIDYNIEDPNFEDRLSISLNGSRLTLGPVNVLSGEIRIPTHSVNVSSGVHTEIVAIMLFDHIPSGTEEKNLSCYFQNRFQLGPYPACL